MKYKIYQEQNNDKINPAVLIFEEKYTDKIISYSSELPTFGPLFENTYRDVEVIKPLWFNEDECPLFKEDYLLEDFITFEASTDEDYYKINSFTSSVFQDTKQFQLKYHLLDFKAKGFLPEENMKVKIGHIYEELKELEKGYEEGDLDQCADAIIDIIYVAAGLGALMNLPMQQLWNDVHIRNMTLKKRCTNTDQTKRGTTFDVKKDLDIWESPKTTAIINEHFKRF